MIFSILFVGNLNSWARSFQRCRALTEMEHAIDIVRSVPDGRFPGLKGRIELVEKVMSKLGFPRDLTQVNRNIRRYIVNKKYDIVWLEKPLMLKPSTLKFVKTKSPKTKICFYSEDDMFLRHNQSVYFKKSIPFYDIIFTTKSYNCNSDELPSLGATKVVFINKAYDRNFHRPVEISSEDYVRLGSDVGFIGRFEQDRAEKTLFLAKNGIHVRIWGNGWSSWVNKHRNLRIENRPIYGDDFVKAICATKINLCFLRKLNRDLQTDRTMEIPACGAFMLAERTEEHRRLFEEDKEAVYFDSNEELLEKVRYYLEHEYERQAIAKAGRQRCLQSGYSHHDRLRFMLNQL